MSDVNRITRLGFVNAYLVRDDDGLTLVDTMLPRSAGRILAAGRDLDAPIVRILLTHAHGDHIGSLDELVAALPGVEVLISAREARLLTKDKSLDPGEPQGKLRGLYPGARTTPTRVLTAGERIGSLEAVASPGHTPGHLAFIDTRDRTMFCGDAFSTLGGVATSARGHPRFPLAAMATWDRPTALQSARALRALDPARLAPGHGRVVESPGSQMDAAIEHAAARQ